VNSILGLQKPYSDAVRLLPFPAINPEWNTFTWLRIGDYQDVTLMDDLSYQETAASDLYPHLQP
jgi:hypothetical protein